MDTIRLPLAQVAAEIAGRSGVIKVPKVPRISRAGKVFLTGIGISIVCGVLLSAGVVIKTPPIIAKELQLAQNTIVLPILNPNLTENKIKRELNLEQKKQLYNQDVRKRYRASVISDIDVGIKHIRLTKYYQGRPIRINVVEINKNLNPELNLAPQLASNGLKSKASISTIARKNNSIVAINGTFFKPQTGVPLGTLMINKKMYTGPIYNRVAMGIFDNGFDMARVQLDAKIKSGRHIVNVDNLNQPRMLASYVLVYTPEWGSYAPPSPKYGEQIAVKDGKVIARSISALAIPENGFVVVGPSSKLEELANQKKMDLEIKTTPEWENVNHIISGGPYLVKNEQIFVDLSEQKLGAIGGRNPRTAIGYTKDGNLVLVAVDGREGSSIGMTLRELASFMKEIGCVNAMNLDGGGSTVMYVKGQIVNRPQNKGGIAISNALTVSKS